MKMTRSRLARFALAVLLSAGVRLPAAALTLDQVLAQMDQVATRFKGLSANVKYMQHMQAIHEDDTQTGTILVKRPRPKDLHVKISIQEPEKKIAVTDGKKVEVYYPSSDEIQEATLGERRSLVDMILTLGFGGSAQELQSNYQVTLGGPETVGGESTTKLELIPKSSAMLEQWNRIDLWISTQNGYTVQQKFYERGKGDYTLITYSNEQLNPQISDSEFNLPKVKKQPLNRKK